MNELYAITKSDELVHYKYTSRWRGSDGKWRYKYRGSETPKHLVTTDYDNSIISYNTVNHRKDSSAIQNRTVKSAHEALSRQKRNTDNMAAAHKHVSKHTGTSLKIVNKKLNLTQTKLKTFIHKVAKIANWVEGRIP